MIPVQNYPFTLISCPIETPSECHRGNHPRVETTYPRLAVINGDITVAQID